MIDATVAPQVEFLSPFGTTVCNVNHINARPEPRLEAGARHERTLEGVGSRPLLDAVDVHTSLQMLGYQRPHPSDVCALLPL
jgi:hypothetical protein